MSVDRKTQTRARKARDKIDKMVREITAWKGEKPSVVRVNMGDYLALTEVGWIRQADASSPALLSGTSLEVKPG